MPTEAITRTRPVTKGPASTRLVISGASGFIGSRIVEAVAGRAEVIALGGREGPAIALTERDVVVTCALHPLYRTQDYDPDHDLERIMADAAARAGARVVMLSTRRVYPAESRWGARESDLASGDETAYGRNKARTEAWLTDALGARACILRLSNVFGFEYRPDGPARTSFFGLMLSRLKARDEILLDVTAETRRDFVPVAWVAEAVIETALAGASGVYNIGGGGPVACGDIAGRVIEGYGRGQLRCGDVTRDEFYLDTSRWVREFGPKGSTQDVLDAARQQGMYLQNA